MKITPTAIADVLVFEPRVFADERGYFMETWRATDFAAIDEKLKFVQDNQSSSLQGTLRGLHYQLQNPQGKLVRVLQGEIYDVAVDLRAASPTFGQWVGVTLSADNKKQLWVPPGFAHGFYVISERAEITYKCTDYYAQGDEYGLLWNDAQLKIDWPLVNQQQPLLSEKDEQARVFSEAALYK